jgi:hypothetical protein
VLIFDNTTLVGVSLGLPLSLEEEALQRPFIERGMDIDSYYYFGDPGLLKEYRGRGIRHHFFDARETHVTQYKKFKHICFCIPDCSETDPTRPTDCVSLTDFWRKRGYLYHPELKTTLFWKKLDETRGSKIQMRFWVKNLHF